VRANFVLSGVATGIRRNMTMTIALVLSTAIALAFVGASILASREITNFKHNYESALNVSLYLCPPTSKDSLIPKDGPCKGTTSEAEMLQTKDTLIGEMHADPIVTSAKFLTQQEVLNRFVKTASDTVRKLTKKEDLPPTIIVTLKDIKKDYKRFLDTYAHKPGVSSASNQSSVLKTLLNVIDGVRIFSVTIALVVLIASILLIANAIQVAAAQRKNETSIMRLVGASRWMTELPFMLETVFATIVGGIIALGLIWIGKEFVLNNVFKVPVQNGVIPNLGSNDILVAGGLGLIAGVILAAITAFATLRLYVKL
jgi:cell division transport system permease protein